MPPSLARRGRETPAPGPGQGTSSCPHAHAASTPAPGRSRGSQHRGLRALQRWALSVLPPAPPCCVPPAPGAAGPDAGAGSHGRTCLQGHSGRVGARPPACPTQQGGHDAASSVTSLPWEERGPCSGGVGGMTGPRPGSSCPHSARPLPWGAQPRGTVTGQRLVFPGRLCTVLSVCD